MYGVKAAAVDCRRIAVAVAFDSLQMSIRAPLPPLQPPPNRNRHLQKLCYVCAQFFSFFSSVVGRVAVSVCVCGFMCARTQTEP